MTSTIQMIGGPFDGRNVPNDNDYFDEGSIHAVNTQSLITPENGWSPESVYCVTKGALVYDAQATKERKAVTDAEPSQLE